VDDLADACLFVMGLDPAQIAGAGGVPIVNVGCGRDDTIRDLAGMVAECVGFAGAVRWDHAHPDGTPRKLLDVSRLTGLGWRPRIPLSEGIRSVYDWYRRQTEAAS
jgi:GDP-L-fucose synthase